MLKDLCCEGCLHKQQGCDSFRVGMQVKNNLSITIPHKFFLSFCPVILVPNGPFFWEGCGSCYLGLFLWVLRAVQTCAAQHGPGSILPRLLNLPFSGSSTCPFGGCPVVFLMK